MFTRKPNEGSGAPAAIASTPPQARKVDDAHGSAPSARPAGDEPRMARSAPGGETSGSRGAPRAPKGSSATTVMNPHLSFEGDLRYTGSVTLDCEFRGSITTDDQLVVGPSGRVEAEITAGNVEIAGKVHGNIHAKSRVKLLAGGELYGDVESPAFSIDDGVVFEGHCTRPQGAPRNGAQASTSADVARVLAGADDLLVTGAEAKSSSGPSRGAEFGT